MSLQMVGVKQMSIHKCAATVGPEVLSKLPKGQRAEMGRKRIQNWLNKRKQDCMAKVKFTPATTSVKKTNKTNEIH